MSTQDRLITVSEAMGRLAVSRTKLYALVAAGKIAIVKIGRASRFKESEISRFLSSLGTEQTV